MQHTQYISTRGQMAPAGFMDVLLAGLAPDGGLAVPERLPALTPEQLETWRSLNYAELATEVIGLFATDIPREDLAALTRAAYGKSRFPQPVVPVTGLDDVADGLVLVNSWTHRAGTAADMGLSRIYSRMAPIITHAGR